MECYALNSGKIANRLDTFYYRPEFVAIEQRIDKLPCKAIKDISSELKNGSTPTGGVFEESGIPFLRSQDFDLFDFQINQYISPEFHKTLSRSSVTTGDILVAVVGATLGVVGYVPDSIKEANINQNVARIRVIDKSVNPKYLAIVLSSQVGQNMLLRNATITAQAYLNNQQLGDIKIPIPSSSIQNKVVEILQSAYEYKKQREQEAENAQSSIDNYVLNRLGIQIPKIEDKQCFAVDSNTLKDHINPYYHQHKFHIVEQALKRGKYTIEPLSNYITKIHYGVSIKNIYVEDGIPLLRITNLKPNRMDLTDVAKLSESKRKEIGNGFVYDGDVLVSRSGSVGIVAVVPKEADGFAFGSFMIKFCLNDKVNKEYVALWLNNKVARLFTEREKIGAIQGNITIGTIELFQIPIPPLDIQNEIADEAKRRIVEAKKLNEEARAILERAKKTVEDMIIGKSKQGDN